MVESWKEASSLGTLLRAVIPSMRTHPSDLISPNHLPKAPPLNSIVSGGRPSMYEFVVNENIQSIVTVKDIFAL